LRRRPERGRKSFVFALIHGENDYIFFFIINFVFRHPLFVRNVRILGITAELNILQ